MRFNRNNSLYRYHGPLLAGLLLRVAR